MKKEPIEITKETNRKLEELAKKERTTKEDILYKAITLLYLQTRQELDTNTYEIKPY